ncbi:MAG: CidA/LrgA family protein [Marinilabiliaceae bacterium]|nr:CidA/LrgA family protein [Marinilabiliaceae bacterium]
MKGVVIILLFLSIGELISYLTGGFIPGNIFGMVIMFLSLQMGIVKEESVSSVSKFLTKNMAIMFLPAGVGLMVAYEIIAENWISILLNITMTTLLVMATVGFIADKKGSDNGK